MNKVNKRIVMALGVIALYLVVGTFFYHYVERWNYIDSFYASGVILTTVGYGGLVPATIAGKIFAVFLAFSGVGIVCYCITILAQRYFQEEVEHGIHKMLHNTERVLKKEEQQMEHAWNKTVVVVKKEEQELASLLKKMGIDHVKTKKGHKRLFR